MMNLQHLPSEAFHARAMDHFRCLYAESAERAKIMAISCHPYLSGVPHRIAHVERTFADILAHDGVVAWDGELDYGERRSPFDGVQLSAADVY
jgi:transposase